MPSETGALPIIDPLSSNWTVPVSPEAEELIVTVNPTAWPTTDASVGLATVTVVAASATLRPTGAPDELELKVGSPPYAAVIEWGPATRSDVSRVAVVTPATVDTPTVAIGVNS